MEEVKHILIQELSESAEAEEQPAAEAGPRNEDSLFFAGLMSGIIKKSRSVQSAKYQNNRAQAEKLLQEYLDAPPSTSCLSFWKDYAESGNLLKLKLSEIALFYLTPPPTSTDVEHLFSTAGDILPKRETDFFLKCGKTAILS
jgi:hypothetical protein